MTNSMTTIENTAFVGIGTDPTVYNNFYRKCFFNHFSPRGRSMRFPGVFESCEFNRAEFKYAVISGSFYNCTFRGAEWVGAILSGPKFYNCDFAAGDITEASGWQGARFNDHCKNLNLKGGAALAYTKDGEYKIIQGSLGAAPLKLVSIREIVAHKNERNSIMPRGYFSGVAGGFKVHGDFGYNDEDTQPGLSITQLQNRKAFLVCSDIEEYKKNCGK